jgi:hypothetical protein
LVLFKDASGNGEVVVDLPPLLQPAEAPALAAAMAGAEAEGSEASALAVESVLAEWSAVRGGEWAGEAPGRLRSHSRFQLPKQVALRAPSMEAYRAAAAAVATATRTPTAAPA